MARWAEGFGSDGRGRGTGGSATSEPPSTSDSDGDACGSTVEWKGKRDRVRVRSQTSTPRQEGRVGSPKVDPSRRSGRHRGVLSGRETSTKGPPVSSVT